MAHRPSRGPSDAVRTVLFVCVENACRSLMAESMFNAIRPAGWIAISAGTFPAGAQNPRTESMLNEIGLRSPGHPPQVLTSEMMEQATLHITMGCLDDASCPARLKELEYRDWGLPDPAPLDDVGFREIRERLRKHVEALARELRGNDDQPSPAPALRR